MYKNLLAMIGSLISIGAYAQCEAPEYREFDFWLGHWQVFTPDNKLVGENMITRAHGGCVLQENYKSQSGFSGQSINMFDAGSQQWHQTWGDNSGTLLRLNGGIERGNMVLSGTRYDKNSQIIQERITWTPNKDGTVRQLWETRIKSDQAQWQTTFDGLYKRINKDNKGK
jgi:hypothetical protein